jgi:hypothetical protein
MVGGKFRHVDLPTILLHMDLLLLLLDTGALNGLVIRYPKKSKWVSVESGLLRNFKGPVRII